MSDRIPKPEDKHYGFVIRDSHSLSFKDGWRPKTKQVKLSWSLEAGYHREEIGELIPVNPDPDASNPYWAFLYR